MNKTPLTTCRECKIAFQVGLIKIPSRNGCYCPECGEYNPYAWNPEARIDFNTGHAVNRDYIEPAVKGDRVNALKAIIKHVGTFNKKYI